MSIYRPSNAMPFLDSIDLTKEQFFSCEVHTSNVPIVGYKIRILDNLNEIIFEGEEYSPVPIGMNLNGATLTVPFIVLRDTDLTFNNIYYNADAQKWYRLNESEEPAEITKFFNGYVHQPYKWRITLTQGDISAINQQPIDKWYDMTITTGQVMGSTINRIQSNLSNYIYKDYFVQLCNNTYSQTDPSLIQKKAFIGTRKLISRYDSSFGYIYPQEGKFTQADINAAKYFQIFKSSNDINTLNSNRVVDFATNRAMSSIKLYLSGNLVGPTSSNFIPDQIEGSDGSAYFTQVFKTNDTSYPLGEYPLQVQAIDLQASPNEYVSIGATRILVKNEGVASNGTLLSPYNGVFVLADSKVVIDEENEGKHSIVLKWQRASDVRSWGSLVGKIYYVKGGSSAGVSFESTATIQTDAIGSINSTPLGFNTEKPIEIFPEGTNWEAKNFGQIYKNTNTTTLIRPFTGINKGMRFSYGVNGILTNLNINNLDNQLWKIDHDDINDPIPVNTSYTISSYFKQGDDCPFYAFDTPEISIQIDGHQNIAGEDIMTKRTLKAIGTYNQKQGKSWKTYRWELLDLGYNSARITELSYTGEISVEFEGIEDGHRYGLILEVEDEMGFTHLSRIFFRADLAELIDGGFSLDANFDCSTHSIDLDFSRYAFITPTPFYTEAGKGISYNDNAMTIDNATGANGMIGENGRKYGVKYEQTRVLLDSSDTASELSGPATNGITINSSHILNLNFEGLIYEAIISDVTEDTYMGAQQRFKIRIEVPTEVIRQGAWTVANPQRNQFLVIFDKERSFDNGEKWVKIDEGEIKTPIIIISNLGIESATWRLSLSEQDSKIVNALVDENDTNQNINRTGYDYLLTEKAYNLKIPNSSPSVFLVGEFRHLPISRVNSHDLMSSRPLTVGASAIGGAFWYDGLLVLAEQVDGSILNVEKVDENNIWEDGNYQWYDSTSGYNNVYSPVDINTLGIRRTGRQEIANKLLVFNVAISNYDTSKIIDQQGFNITGRCFVNETQGN